MNEKSKIFAIKALIAPVLVAIPIFFMQAKGLMSGSESVMRTKITRQSKTLSSSEQTSENNRLLKTMLSNHPMADLEGNGILTMGNPLLTRIRIKSLVPLEHMMSL